jgi:hypothetical protein
MDVQGLGPRNARGLQQVLGVHHEVRGVIHEMRGVIQQIASTFPGRCSKPFMISIGLIHELRREPQASAWRVPRDSWGSCMKRVGASSGLSVLPKHILGPICDVHGLLDEMA